MRGRPKLAPRRPITFYLEEDIYHQMFLLCPELTNAQGFTKHGAISGYLTSLVRQDLDRRTRQLQARLQTPGD